MRKASLIGLFTLLGLALALVGCGKQVGTSANTPTGPANTIGMGTNTFDQKSITVKANTPVHFTDNTGGGGTHIVCVAAGSSYSTNCETASSAPNAPKELLAPGMNFSPGDSKDITFTTAGTYNVVCTVHPGMQITVTVQ
jgi:plastocyanin